MSKEKNASGAQVPCIDLLANGNACIVGDIHVIDDPEALGGSETPEKIAFALVIQFEGPEQIRKALKDGACRFTVLGG